MHVRSPLSTLLLLTAGLLAGCGHRLVNVSVLGIAAGPNDWDAMGTAQQVPPGAVAALAGLDPFTGVAGSVILPPLLSSMAPPDLTGTVTLACDGQLSGQVRGIPQVHAVRASTPRAPRE